MKKEIINEGIRRFQSPLYIYDLDAATAEVERFRKCFGDKIDLCFAMKANPFIVSHMAKLVDKIEVCSFGEFLICEKLQIPPEKMLISGVLKEPKDLPHILSYCQDQSIYTAESEEQFHQLGRWSTKNEKNLRVYIRLTSGNQFGVDEDVFLNLIRSLKDYPFLTVAGIHYFTGTQKRQAKTIEKELNRIDAFIKKIEEETGLVIENFEYGPGVGVQYFEGKDVPLFEDEGLQELSNLVDGLDYKKAITFEMGRALSARCGVYITQILDMKTNMDVNYCIVNGGMHQMNYDGQIKGMYHPFVDVISDTHVESDKEWTVCGSLCTFNDVLTSEIRLGELSIGDYLVFNNAGAYSVMEGMALFLSHELPAVALYSSSTGLVEARAMQSTFQFNTIQRRMNYGRIIRDFK